MAVNDRDCDPIFPLDVDNEELNSNLANIAPSFTPANESFSVASPMTGFGAICRLSQVLGNVINSVHSVQFHHKEMLWKKISHLRSVIQSLDQNTAEWVQLAPDFESLPRQDPNWDQSATMRVIASIIREGSIITLHW